MVINLAGFGSLRIVVILLISRQVNSMGNHKANQTTLKHKSSAETIYSFFFIHLIHDPVQSELSTKLDHSTKARCYHMPSYVENVYFLINACAASYLMIYSYDWNCWWEIDWFLNLICDEFLAWLVSLDNCNDHVLAHLWCTMCGNFLTAVLRC